MIYLLVAYVAYEGQTFVERTFDTLDEARRVGIEDYLPAYDGFYVYAIDPATKVLHKVLEMS